MILGQHSPKSLVLAPEGCERAWLLGRSLGLAWMCAGRSRLETMPGWDEFLF